MIDKSYGKYALFCDVCGEMEDNFETFQDVIDGAKELGWVTQKVDKGLEDVCPNCK